MTTPKLKPDANALLAKLAVAYSVGEDDRDAAERTFMDGALQALANLPRLLEANSGIGPLYLARAVAIIELEQDEEQEGKK